MNVADFLPAMNKSFWTYAPTLPVNKERIFLVLRWAPFTFTVILIDRLSSLPKNVKEHLHEKLRS